MDDSIMKRNHPWEEKKTSYEKISHGQGGD
jgi:hypothetical protein